MLTFLKNLQFIFRPSFWIMLRPYCPAHDKLINKLMDEHEFSEFNSFTAKLGKHEVWIANMPYATGLTMFYQSSRPSRLTILRIRRKMSIEMVKNYD